MSPENDQPDQSGSNGEDDVDRFIDDVFARDNEFKSDVANVRANQQKVVYTLKELGVDTKYFQTLIDSLPEDEDFSNSIYQIGREIALITQHGEEQLDPEELNTLEVLRVKLAQIDWIVEIADAMEIWSKEDKESGLKMRAQARIMIDEALDDEWKEGLVQTLGVLTPGKSFNDLSEEEKLIVVAEAHLKESAEEKFEKLRINALRAIREFLADYKDHSDFNYVTSLLEVVANSISYGKERDDLFRQSIDKSLKAYGLSLDNYLVQQAINRAVEIFREQ